MSTLGDLLPLHLWVHEQAYPILKPNQCLGWNTASLDQIHLKAIVKRNDLALHAQRDNSGTTF